MSAVDKIVTIGSSIWQTKLVTDPADAVVTAFMAAVNRIQYTGVVIDFGSDNAISISIDPTKIGDNIGALYTLSDGTVIASDFTAKTSRKPFNGTARYLFIAGEFELVFTSPQDKLIIMDQLPASSNPTPSGSTTIDLNSIINMMMMMMIMKSMTSGMSGV